LYGPGYNFDIKNSHVIPAIIKKIFLAKKNKKKHITLFGSGNQKREFLFITDAAIAIVKSVKRNTQSPLINIGTGKAYDIKFIAKTIAKLMSYRGKIIWDTKINSGILKKNFNINKAKKELKFLPKIKIEEGLKKTIIFFRKKND
jgi:GDP-L-fucose synthase